MAKPERPQPRLPKLRPIINEIGALATSRTPQPVLRRSFRLTGGGSLGFAAMVVTSLFSDGLA